MSDPAPPSPDPNPTPVADTQLTSFSGDPNLLEIFEFSSHGGVDSSKPDSEIEALIQRHEASETFARWDFAYERRIETLKRLDHHPHPALTGTSTFKIPQVSAPKRDTKQGFVDSGVDVGPSSLAPPDRTLASHDHQPKVDLVGYWRNQNCPIDPSETLEDHQFRVTVAQNGIVTVAEGVGTCDGCGGEVDLQDVATVFRCGFVLGLLECGRYRCGECWSLREGNLKAERGDRCRVEETSVVKIQLACEDVGGEKQ